jgi:hypothetical protein
MTSSGDPADSRDTPSEDLAALVIAAGQRGFSRWQVATALGIPARGLASIEERIEVNACDDGLDGEATFMPRRRQTGQQAQSREHEADGITVVTGTPSTCGHAR